MFQGCSALHNLATILMPAYYWAVLLTPHL